MERDMQLICDLLETIKEHPERSVYVATEEEYGNISKSTTHQHNQLAEAPKGCSKEKLHYHLILLIQAGLIIPGNPDSINYFVAEVEVSWDGHEFIDNLRTVGGWQTVKDKMGQIQNASFSIISQNLAKLATENLTGI